MSFGLQKMLPDAKAPSSGLSATFSPLPGEEGAVYGNS